MVALLATLGWIVADFVKLPGDVHAVSSLEAHNAAVSSGALIQVLLWSVYQINTISFTILLADL